MVTSVSLFQVRCAQAVTFVSFEESKSWVICIILLYLWQPLPQACLTRLCCSTKDTNMALCLWLSLYKAENRSSPNYSKLNTYFTGAHFFTFPAQIRRTLLKMYTQINYHGVPMNPILVFKIYIFLIPLRCATVQKRLETTGLYNHLKNGTHYETESKWIITLLGLWFF